MESQQGYAVKENETNNEELDIFGLPKNKEFFKEHRLPYSDRERYGSVAPRRDNVISEMWDAGKLAGVNVIGGIGSTFEELGLGGELRRWRDKFVKNNPQLQPAPGDEKPFNSFTSFMRTATEGAVTSLPAIGATVATGGIGGGVIAGAMAGMAVTSSQLLGDNVKEYRERLSSLGYSEGEIYGLAVLDTLGQAGMEQGLGSVPLAGRLAKGALSATDRALLKGLGDMAKKEGIPNAVKKFSPYLSGVATVAGRNAVEEGMEEVGQSFIHEMIARGAGAEAQDMNLGEAFLGGVAGSAFVGLGGGARVGRQFHKAIHGDTKQKVDQTVTTPDVNPDGTPVDRTATTPKAEQQGEVKTEEGLGKDVMLTQDNGKIIGFHHIF